MMLLRYFALISRQLANIVTRINICYSIAPSCRIQDTVCDDTPCIKS